MSIATGAEFGFAEIAKFKAEVINKVGYKDIFFLVKEALKILLG
jgi:hypothetical protein